LSGITSLSFFWSRSFLLSRSMLWLVFIINLGGTVYGYIWYQNQLIYTAENMPLWYLPFVPDSPTASLFFTLSLIWLLVDQYRSSGRYAPLYPKGGFSVNKAVRGFVEALAFITSFKYGIWAVAMIVADSQLGNPIVWQSWMLIVSHLGMAVEVLLYGAFYRYGFAALALASAWSFWNDYMDYDRGIFPSLSRELRGHLDVIQPFTIAMSVISIFLALVYLLVRRRKRKV